MTPRFRERAFLVLCLVSLAGGWSTACVPPPTFRAADDRTGGASFALAIVPGLTLDTATYTITAPAFTRTGTLDLRESSTLSGTISGLPAGDGYTISITGTLSDGVTACLGSAPFAVTARATTSVSILLLCREPTSTGSVQIGGRVNVCPLIDGVSATPGEVMVGAHLALGGAAHDTDKAPAPLALRWTASSGTISDATIAAPTFTCTGAGAVTVSLTASDGDCTDTASLTVTCSLPPAIVINEVESSGGVPGDWAELYNAGTSAVDISGWIFKDNDDTHAYAIPPGTIVAAGGYFLLEEAAFGFGLGAADAARLYDPNAILIDSYSWTAHAATTYGRCPSGVGPFSTTVSVTKGVANDCGGVPVSDGGATGGADGASDGGVVVNDGGVASLPWPGANEVVVVDSVAQFAGNLSGLSYDPATPAGPAVLWAVQNGPSNLYRLLWNGTTWASTTSDDWTAGKALHYPDGTGAPDSEGVTKAELDSPAVYVSTERDDDAGGVSRLSVLRFDTTALGPALVATHEWNLTADLPVAGPNLGLEAITWIPDGFLTLAGFIDESTGGAYDPAVYPNHGSGIFFVGLEANGAVYGFALDHASGGFKRVATFPGGQSSVMDLSFDRETGYLWAYCDNTCGNRAAVLQIDGAASSPARGRFALSRLFDRPGTMPDINNEGIAIAPEAECSNGRKPFFWADDAATDGNSLRRDSIPCGRFF